MLWMAGPPQVGISLSTTQCFEPCSTVAHVTIVDYEMEREFCVAVVDGGDEEAGVDGAIVLTCRQWTGRKITDIPLRGIPAGVYRVVASLTHPSGEGKRASASLNVIEQFRVKKEQ